MDIPKPDMSDICCPSLCLYVLFYSITKLKKRKKKEKNYAPLNSFFPAKEEPGGAQELKKNRAGGAVP